MLLKRSSTAFDAVFFPELLVVIGVHSLMLTVGFCISYFEFIKVSMYDDRLEIESPCRSPNIVTADNISYTRFSRNKAISRVMTEFEWVYELKEGVKKIYLDMAEAGFPEPE